MFTCENCHRPFKEQSSLLRHVSHRESCKSYYGSEKLEDVKKASRLVSKRKWIKAHSAEVKSKRKKDKESGKEPRKGYVKSDVGKDTPAGKMFVRFYENVYHEALEKIVDDKLQEAAYDAIYNSAWDSAIDLTMKSDDYVKYFEANINYFVDEGIRDDVDIEAELDKAFETSFDRLLKSEINKKMESWISSRRFDIYQKCAKQGERTVFSNYFEEFKNDIFTNLSAEAMDLAFSALDEQSDSEATIEWELDKTYREQMRTLVDECSEKSDFSRKIFKIVYNMMYRKAIMWIKLNKLFTD